jgi:hypothetical protein
MKARNIQATLILLACLAAFRCPAPIAVGYFNLPCPPGFSLIAVPAYGYPNNDPANLIDNTSGAYNGCEIFFWQNGTWAEYIANNNPTTQVSTTNGWEEPNGPMLLLPGGGAAFYNPSNAGVILTLFGEIPQGALTNTINPGLNLVSSMVGVSGDLSANSVMTFPSLAGGQFDGDQVFLLFSSGNGSNGYTTYTVDSLSYNPPGNYGWDGLPGQPDPVLNVGQAFWYRAGNGAVQWTEYYTVSDAAPADPVKSKTSTAMGGFDAVWSSVRIKSRHFQATLTGQAGKPHVVEVSSDLRNWNPVRTNLWASGKFVYTDPVPATNKMRFYRAFALP